MACDVEQRDHDDDAWNQTFDLVDFHHDNDPDHAYSDNEPNTCNCEDSAPPESDNADNDVPPNGSRRLPHKAFKLSNTGVPKVCVSSTYFKLNYLNTIVLCNGHIMAEMVPAHSTDVCTKVDWLPT